MRAQVAAKLERNGKHSVRKSETTNSFILDMNRRGNWIDLILRDQKDEMAVAEYGYNVREKRWSYDSKPVNAIIRALNEHMKEVWIDSSRQAPAMSQPMTYMSGGLQWENE